MAVVLPHKIPAAPERSTVPTSVPPDEQQRMAGSALAAPVLCLSGFYCQVFSSPALEIKSKKKKSLFIHFFLKGEAENFAQKRKIQHIPLLQKRVSGEMGKKRTQNSPSAMITFYFLMLSKKRITPQISDRFGNRSIWRIFLLQLNEENKSIRCVL